MTCIVKLLYDRKIRLEKKRKLSEDPNIKPYLDIIDEIVKKYKDSDLKRVGISYQERGFFRPYNVLCSIQYNSPTIKQACDFAKKVLLKEISPKKFRLADRVEIDPLKKRIFSR